MFGGMGSFNDLVLHPMNGHPVETNDVAEVNASLSDPRSTVYGACVELRHTAR